MARIHAAAFDAPWDEAAFNSLLDSPGVVSIGDERGFILIRTIVDEAEILTVAVLPAFRRQGLGRILVEQAVVGACAQGARRMFLEVAQGNRAALALYEASGFVTTGVRKAYYGRPDGTREDARVMVLNFPL